MERLSRSSNNINIASFWENYQLGKYNFDPVYQRRGDVWNDQKKSFLIDTVMKNFPMPPIFLHQHIDSETGKTIYEIIDGKQRLQSIVDFIKGKISLPNNYSEDTFGNESLNGINFKDLDKDHLAEAKKMFWRYCITIEYIDSEDPTIINNIFDRLNRNGEPLNSQELRKAKYHNSPFYMLIEDLNKTPFWQANLQKLGINRYDDIEFISELLLLILKNEVNDASSKDKLDGLYDIFCSENQSLVIKEQYEELKQKFQNITNILLDFNLNLAGYGIDSVSHLYGLWGFAWVLYQNGINTDLSEKLNVFYSDLRNRIFENESIKAYRSSMQANTKSKSYRIRRINSLLSYCGLSDYQI